MNNANMPAMPITLEPGEVWSEEQDHAHGLTKREYFAAMAMTSSSNPYDAHDHKSRAKWALREADTLLEESGNGEA